MMPYGSCGSLKPRQFMSTGNLLRRARSGDASFVTTPLPVMKKFIRFSGRCRWGYNPGIPTPTGMPSPRKPKNTSTRKRKRLSQPVARELARRTRSKTDKNASDAARWLLDVAAKNQGSKPKLSPKKRGRMFRSRIRKQCFFNFRKLLFKTACR